MTTRTLSIPGFSTAILEGANRIAGFIRGPVEAIYEAVFRRVLRAIAHTV
jgi:hypothetical protein